MKTAVALLLPLCLLLGDGTGTLGAEALSNGMAGGGLGTIEIEWSAAATNAWPDRLWVYGVVPQEFSAAVVSNLLALGQFTPADENEAPAYKAEVDKRARVFGTLEGTCKHMVICPTLGFISYINPKAEAHSSLEPVVGVPTPEEARRLGLKCLRLAGVDVSQLATKPGSSDLDLYWAPGTIGYNDEKTGKEITLTNVMEVKFLRRVDGLNMTGTGWVGGVYVRFGNNGAVADLQITWRNLRPEQLSECAGPEQIEKWVRARQVVFWSSRGPVPADFGRLKIFKATFLYEGEDGEIMMDFMYPYGVFEAEAVSAGKTNVVVFKAPMTLAKQNWRAVRDY